MTRRVNAAGFRRNAPLAALLLLAAALPCAARAAADVRVAASIPPVHSLAAQVMAGAGTPQLLIPAGASPHGFALTPSQARLLAESEVVLWIGPGLETALVRPISALAGKARVVTLSGAAGLNRLPVRRLDGHAGGHAEGPAHAHPAVADDPHYWLDPENARAMLAAVADALAAADPARRDLYARNAAAARARIEAMTAGFHRRLAAVKDRPFMVFHDAYQYLERRFGLTAAGILAVDPDRPAGARHIADLRDRLRRLNVACLFTEPQFPSRLADALVRGTATRIAVLDPLGSGLAPGPDLYERMMTANLQALEDCLGAAP